MKIIYQAALLVSIWLSLSGAAAIVAAGGTSEQHEKITKLFIHAWVPELGPVQVDAKSPEARLLEIAELTLQGKFVLAEQRLDAFESEPNEKRIAFLIDLFRIELVQRRYRMIGDVRLSRGESQLDRVKMNLTLQALNAKLVAIAGQMSDDEKADAVQAFTYARNLNLCLHEIPGLVRSSKITQVFNRDMLQPAPEEPGMKCVQIFTALNLEANRTGVLSQTEQNVLFALLRGNFAVANQDFSSAKEIYQNAVVLTGIPLRIKATFMLARGDIDAAPYGNVLSFGYNLHAENTGIRGVLYLGGVPSVLAARSSAELTSAESWYGRAEEIARSTTDVELTYQVTMRLAYLAGLKGNFEASAKLYAEAAENARKHGFIRDAAIAEVSHAFVKILVSQPDDRVSILLVAMDDAIHSLVENGDMAGLISIVEMTNSWATRATYNGDFAQASIVLRQIVKALVTNNQNQPTVDLLSTLATVYAGYGRAESAIEVLQEAISQQEHYIDKANSLNEEYRKTHVELGNDPVGVVSDKLVAALLLSKLGGIISAKFLEEHTALWKEQLDIVDKKGDVLAEQVAKEVPVLTEKMRQLVLDRQVERRSSSFESDALRDLRSRLTCQGVLQLREKYRNHETEFGDPLRAIGFDVEVARCDPDLLRFPQAELEKANPVASFRQALAARNQSQTATSFIQVSDARQLLTRYLSLAIAAEAFDLTDRWLAQLDELLRDSPRDPVLIPIAREYRARMLLGQKQPERARDILENLAKDTTVLAAGPKFRIQLFNDLVEAEAPLDNYALESLFSFEQMRFEQERWQRQRSGMNSLSKSSAEIAMLERLAATGNGLNDSQLNRLRELQDEAERNAPPEQQRPSRKAFEDTLKVIGEDSTVLIYHTGWRFITLWCVRPGQPVTVKRLESPPEDIMRLVVRFERSLSGGGGNNEWESLSGELYKRLIAPAKLARGDSRLIFLVQGKLSLIPFEVLGPDKEHLLLVNHSVSYISRLTGGRVYTHGNTNAGGAALVVGPSQDLPKAINEANSIARLLGGKSLMGKEATYQNIRSRIGSAQWIHFATHGVVNRTNPYLSYLDLFGGERIEAWQLFHDIPQAEIISLSACDTKQEAQDTSDLSSEAADSNSLAAFGFAGGARWVLASLWQADDEKTETLMVEFYGRLKREGVAPDKALQMAKLQMFKSQIHPGLYSQFVLTAHDLSSFVFEK